MNSDTVETVETAIGIDNFDTQKLSALLIKAGEQLEQRCPVGSGQAITTKDLALACELDEDQKGFFSMLYHLGMMPKWTIGFGPGGGLHRVGEAKATKSGKAPVAWLDTLNQILAGCGDAVNRNDIAHKLAAATGLDVLTLPAKISEAVSKGQCPGFATKPGKGIHRFVAVAPVEVVTETVTETAEVAEALVVETVDSTPESVQIEVTDTEEPPPAPTPEPPVVEPAKANKRNRKHR